MHFTTSCKESISSGTFAHTSEVAKEELCLGTPNTISTSIAARLLQGSSWRFSTVFCLFFIILTTNHTLFAQTNPDSLTQATGVWIDGEWVQGVWVKGIAAEHYVPPSMMDRLRKLYSGNARVSQAKVFEFDTLLTGSGAIACAAVDPLAQILIGYTNGNIERYDSLATRLQVTYTNQRLGAPSMIDASNPLRVLVYYAQSQQIMILNRNLVEISSLDLNRLGYASVPSVGAARDGNLWIFDALTFQIKKLDMQGRLLLEGARLYEINAPEPRIFDFGDHLIWQTDHNKVQEFSPYAQDDGSKSVFDGGIVAFLPTETGYFSLTNLMLERNWRNEFGDLIGASLGLIYQGDARFGLLAPALGLVSDKRTWALIRLK
jgi:hypothetical protein